mgnify:CR=1 FL=1
MNYTMTVTETFLYELHHDVTRCPLLQTKERQTHPDGGAGLCVCVCVRVWVKFTGLYIVL